MPVEILVAQPQPTVNSLLFFADIIK